MKSKGTLMSENSYPTEINPELCAPNPWNPKGREPDAEMLASVAAKGVDTPILLRPQPGSKSPYQIIAGERRWKAAKAAKRSLPCRIREVSDQEAYEMSFRENRQREGLAPLEEAAIVGAMLTKFEAGDVAANLGMSVQVVRRRAQLLKLTPSWKKAAVSEHFRTWTAAHLERIASRPASVQDLLLKDEFEFDQADTTLEDLDRVLSGMMHDLKAAPWDCADATLVPKAGACNACPKRTGANADLFEEVKGKAKAGDRCLDNECWASKAAATIEKKKESLREEHGAVFEIAVSSYQKEKGQLTQADVKVVSAKTKGAKPAILIDKNGGTEHGKTVFVVPVKSTEDDAAELGKKTVKDRIKALEKRRRVWMLKEGIKHLESDLEWPEKDRALVLAMIHVFGTDDRNAWRQSEKARSWAAVHGFAKKPPTVAELWARVRGVVVNSLHQEINSSEPELEPLEEIAALTSLDMKELRKKAEVEIKTPSTLEGK